MGCMHHPSLKRIFDQRWYLILFYKIIEARFNPSADQISINLGWCIQPYALCNAHYYKLIKNKLLVIQVEEK